MSKMPAAPPRFGLYRTPMWGEAEPSTIAALDRARAALERAGAWIAEIVVPPEHQSLTCRAGNGHGLRAGAGARL